MMTKHYLFPIAIFLFAVSTFALLDPDHTFAQQTSNSSEKIIHMGADGYRPKDVEMKKGQTITFENTDTRDRWPASNIHPTHGIYPEFDPKKPIGANQNWQFKFDKVGTWHYHDHLYPQLTGQITVIDSQNSQAKNPGLLSLAWQKIVGIKNSLAEALSSIKIFNKDQKGKEQKPQEVKPIPNVSKIDIESLFKNLNFTCERQDYRCVVHTLKNITEANGPQAAFSVLDNLLAEEKVSRSVDNHQLAHEIGRQTAKTYGYNGQSFLLCPMSAYNGGCQHGFFENALGKSQNSKEAIELVCGSLDNSYSSKFRFYCYHGVGHGVMMAQAYDLEKSLDICNSIGTNGQNGCWQGVFMENVNSIMKGQAKEGVFSRTDPLAPCSKVEEKYRHECFINHAGFLAGFFKMDLSLASKSCLSAPPNNINACLQSLGLMVTNPSWQKNLAPLSPANDQTAWQLCLKFPKNHINECVVGAIDNIMNFNELNVTKAQSFCNLIAQNFKEQCYRRVGSSLKSQSLDEEVVRNLCRQIEIQNFQNICLKGAGLKND